MSFEVLEIASQAFFTKTSLCYEDVFAERAL